MTYRKCWRIDYEWLIENVEGENENEDLNDFSNSNENDFTN